MQFTFHIIYSFKVYSWMFFSILTSIDAVAQRCSHQGQFQHICITSKRSPYSITEKAREFQKKKNIYFSLIGYAKAFDCKTVENSERDGNTRLPDLTPEKSICRSRSNSLSWTQNRLVPNQERSASRLYTVTLLI